MINYVGDQEDGRRAKGSDHSSRSQTAVAQVLQQPLQSLLR